MGNLLMDWKAVGKKESFFTIVGTWCSVAFFPTVGFHLIPPPNITLSECYLGTQTGGGSFFLHGKLKENTVVVLFLCSKSAPEGACGIPRHIIPRGATLQGPAGQHTHSVNQQPTERC